MRTVVLEVPDISCAHCERTITAALTPLDGVRAVRVDIPARRVTVEFDPDTIEVERMTQVLEEEEYPVESVVST